MDCGIIGFPGSGKTCLFQALTGHTVALQRGTLKPNIGQANIPDPNLQEIAKFIPTDKIIPARINLVDIPGIAANSGPSRAAVFSHIRNVDALCSVINCFDHAVDPVESYGDLKLELILSDLEVIENSLEKAAKSVRGGRDEAIRRRETLSKAKALLENEKPISLGSWRLDEEIFMRGYGLLSAKPMLVVANVAEVAVNSQDKELDILKTSVLGDGGAVIVLCAALESEVAELPPEERIDMLASMGLVEAAVGPLARGLNELLGLATFYTAGAKEVRSWIIRQGATAPEAGGTVHSDIERGFIRAECYGLDDLRTLGSEKAIKDGGKLRSEGKQYILKDGDIVHFLFNV